MPLQNRVNPFGELFRTPARGTLMGNRGGAIHNAEQQIVRQYKSRCWIACVLEFRGRRRKVMSPGLYTELFFLDEATALAAGHRPCAECRRDRFNAFKDAWVRATARYETQPIRVREIDLELHRARMGARREKITYTQSVGELPDGCMVQNSGSAYLISGDGLLLWSPEGYTKKIERRSGDVVTVLTPRPIVECLRHGYTPGVHESAVLT